MRKLALSDNIAAGMRGLATPTMRTYNSSVFVGTQTVGRFCGTGKHGDLAQGAEAIPQPLIRHSSNVISPQPGNSASNRVRIVVATSVMLTFISFWRAAAIVLNDLGSSAFYAGGIAEHAIGKSAPWFILAIMLFSFAVRAVYIESCSMFVRGGVYRVVKEAMGGTLAKFSVSALMFDYILTGPISGVSAGQYIAGLINDIFVTADAHGWIPRAVHSMFQRYSSRRC